MTSRRSPAPVDAAGTPGAPTPPAGRRRLLLLPVPAVAVTVAVVIAVAPGGGGPDRAGAAQPSGSTPITLGGPYGRIALADGWTVANDPKNKGASRGWAKGTFGGRTVQVPYVPNANRITGAAGVLSHRGSVAWYRKTVDIDADGTYAVAFGSVNHKATVWIDGKLVEKHTGEFLPFEAKASLKRGRHTIVVRADWRDPEKLKQEGWHRLWFNFGGINREVTIRRLGASEVLAPYVQTRLQPDGTARVTISAELVNRGVARSVAASGVLRREGTDIPFTFKAQNMLPGQSRRVQTAFDVQSPALWAPGSPNLYDLTVAVPGESAYQTRTGLRQVEKRGTAIYLNGKRIQLRGASIHEDAPGYGTGLHAAQMDELVDDLKKTGANATRAQHTLSPALLERLDAAGIMVWQGIGPTDSPGAWFSDTPSEKRTARERVRTSFDETQTHPSIIVWNLVNEMASNGNDKGQVPYVQASQRFLHQNDPSRLVALDIWGTHLPKGKLGKVYDGIDAVGITSYLGWYTAPGKSMASLRRRILRYQANIAKIYRDKAVVYTEFGAEANGENPSAKPGGYTYQSKLLDTTIRTDGADPRISGTIVWNLRDFAVAPTFLGGSIRNAYKGPIRLVRGLNQKGLFTYGGRPKPAVAVVKKAFAAVAASQPTD